MVRKQCDTDGQKCIPLHIRRTCLVLPILQFGDEMQPMQRLNCWEFMKCGREPSGSRVDESGICPAALPGAHEGTNRGSRRGRICWAVEGTLCAKRHSGQATDKVLHCVHCRFFMSVQEQESGDFVLMPD